ncbi:MAG: Lsr2 dimerization domain-containing protein [Acidimicrobiales bacterium]
MTRETKTVVILLCDLHEGEVRAEATVSFAANGTTYEMELCPEHLAQYEGTIEAWTKGARPVTTTRRRRAAPTRESGREDGGQRRGEPDPGEVREWARANGYEISDRGRVAQAVLDAFRTAQSTAQGQPG